MKKSARSCIIMQRLLDHPNVDYSLGAFAREFECAKSSISEDLKLIKEAVDCSGSGRVETTPGAKGGVRYIPFISKNEALDILNKLKPRFEEADRMLGSGFIYTSDLMFDPVFAKSCAKVFARHFAGVKADTVVTVETKGISVATFAADMLGLPLVVIRRESKISDGSTISINYFSGSSDRIQKMSLSKRALKPGSKAIIIDDFIRGGGSIKGVEDMLNEFNCQVSGVGVVLSLEGEKLMNPGEYFPLFTIDTKCFSEGIIKLEINEKNL